MKPPLIPKWISVLSTLISLLGLFVGCSLYFSPGTFIHDVDFSISSVRCLAYMWAARQISIAAIIGFSVIRKSGPMLQVSLMAYCLVNIQDAGIGVSRGDPGLMIGASVFGALSCYMALRLSRLKNS